MPVYRYRYIRNFVFYLFVGAGQSSRFNRSDHPAASSSPVCARGRHPATANPEVEGARINQTHQVEGAAAGWHAGALLSACDTDSNLNHHLKRLHLIAACPFTRRPERSQFPPGTSDAGSCTGRHARTDPDPWKHLRAAELAPFLVRQ